VITKVPKVPKISKRVVGAGKKTLASHIRKWSGRTFRFNLQSFRLKDGVSLRRFTIAEGAFLLMLGLLASRFLGVGRQMFFNAIFGTGPAATAYYAAYRLPDTLFNLISGGSLISAFVPILLAYEQRDGEHEAWRLASLVFNVLLVAMTLLIVGAEYVVPTFVNKILVPGYPPSQQALTTSLTRVMLIMPLIQSLNAVLTAVLSYKRQFLLPAVSIAVYNFGMIGGLLVTLIMPSVGIYGPTCGVLVASLLQVAVQIPALLKQGVRYTFTWNILHPGLRQVLYLLIPNGLAVGVAYIGPIWETHVVSFLPDPASLAALNNAEMLWNVPIALISQAMAQSLLPMLSLYFTSGRYVRLRQTAIKVIGMSILLTVPAAIGLVILGKPAITLIFQHGAFNQHSSDLTGLALMGYALALPGYAAGSLIASGFFALKDTLTPLCTNTFALISRIGQLTVLPHMLPGQIIILAVPLALAGSATAEAVLMSLILLVRLSRRIGKDKGMARLRQRRLYQQSLQVE
jgi:putative peptidoglycan lipid II flippase